MDINTQKEITKIIDGFSGSAIAPTNESLLTEAKWSEILNDINVEKLKKKTFNSADLTKLYKIIRQYITNAGYILGRGKIANDILPKIKTADDVISAPFTGGSKFPKSIAPINMPPKPELPPSTSSSSSSLASIPQSAFEEKTGSQLNSIKTILEFGGGYGSESMGCIE